MKELEKQLAKLHKQLHLLINKPDKTPEDLAQLVALHKAIPALEECIELLKKITS